MESYYMAKYELCKKFNFNLERIREYCRIRNKNYRNILYQARKYMVYTIQDFSKMPDIEIAFMSKNEEIYEIILLFKRVIIDRNIKFKIFDKKNILHDITTSLNNYINENRDKINIMINQFNLWNIRHNSNEAILLIRYLINIEKANINDVKNNWKFLCDKRIETKLDLINGILNTDGEELFNLIDSSIQDYKTLNDFDYSIFYNDKNQNEINIKVKSKIKQFEEYKKLINSKHDEIKSQNIIEIATKYISNYLNSDFENQQAFCNQNKISYNYFKYYLEIVKKNNKELYEAYRIKNEQVIRNNFDNLINLAETIINKIKYGIIENGIKRKFDLLDYYQITDIDPSSLLNILMSKRINNWFTFLNFVKKHSYSLMLTEKRIEKILNEKEVINVEFDESGNMIPNSGYEITKEDKLAVINYLKENNIPLLEEIYYDGLKRYLNNTLISEEKVKVLNLNK